MGIRNVTISFILAFSRNICQSEADNSKYNHNSITIFPMAWLVLFTVMSLGLIINLFLMIYLLSYYKKWKNLQILTFNLAISDFLQQITMATVTFHIKKRIMNQVIDIIVVACAHYFITVSVFHIIVLAAERLIAIRAPFWARVNLTKRRTTIASVLGWLMLGIAHISGFLIIIYCVNRKGFEEIVYQAMYINSCLGLTMSCGIVFV